MSILQVKTKIPKFNTTLVLKMAISVFNKVSN